MRTPEKEKARTLEKEKVRTPEKEKARTLEKEKEITLEKEKEITLEKEKATTLEKSKQQSQLMMPMILMTLLPPKVTTSTSILTSMFKPRTSIHITIATIQVQARLQLLRLSQQLKLLSPKLPVETLKKLQLRMHPKSLQLDQIMFTSHSVTHKC